MKEWTRQKDDKGLTLYAQLVGNHLGARVENSEHGAGEVTDVQGNGTITVTFGINDSPLAGRDGKKVQSRVTANSETEYMRTCLEENHDMIEAINFLGKLRHRGVAAGRALFGFCGDSSKEI